MKRRYEAGLVALFLILSSAVFFYWRSNDLYGTTGDEPHYLVIADGLLPTFELEQTGPYTREFRNRTIMENGLAATDATPGPANTHAVEGPRGLFNVHNIGLPIVLSLPYLFGGETAARLTMIAIGAAIIWLLFQIASLTPLSARARTLLVAPWSIALPFVPAATQIYPDLPAGAISLLAIYFLWREKDAVRNWQKWGAIAALSFLPWLHLRFALPMGILLLALTWHWRLTAARPQRLLLQVWALPVVSLFLLASYNQYAFGNPSGPYESEAIMLNGTAVMQFLGLLLDQNQGLFIQQPLHFVGLFFLIALLRKNPVAVVSTLLVVLGTLGPNATHWNLYGGWSLSGRFGWSAVVVFSSISVMALAHLWQSHQRIAKFVLALGIIFQLRLLAEIILDKADLYPRVFNGWIGTYSTFWSGIETSLPHWRDVRWAFSYVPNVVWLFLTLGIFIIGSMKFLTVRQTSYALGGLLLVSVSSLAAHAQLGDLPYPEQRWLAAGLPGNIGAVEGGTRVISEEGTTGLLTYGPYWETPEGVYEVGVRYRADSPSDSNALLDINSPERSKLVDQVPLKNTNGEVQEFFMQFSIDSTTQGKIELRTFYEGEGNLTVEWIQLRRVSDNVRE